MAEKTCYGDFVAGFLIGAMVGAAATLLFAPQSGEDTRTMIRDRGIELRDRAEDLNAQARKRAADLQTEAQTRASEIQSRVKDAIEEGKTVASQRKEDLLSQLKDEQGPVEPEPEG